MTNLRKRVTLVFAMVAGVSAGLAALVACSSEDTVVNEDGGPDSGPDAKHDTGGDDTGTDSGEQDAGKDVIQVEAASLADFLDQNATATCQRYAECCPAQAGKTFDMAQCQADFKTYGWDRSLYDLYPSGVDGGLANSAKVTYDSTLGSQCLTAVRNMTCANTPAAEFRDAWQKCFDAVKGTANAGTGCASNAECAPGNWCDPKADGGPAGAALLAAGSECQPLAGECSYRGAGAVQCRDDGTGAYKCGAPLANGTYCDYDFTCNSGACSVRDAGVVDGEAQVNSTCENTTDFLFGICGLYVK